MTELITPRLRLRPARPDDLDDLHAVLSDPAAMRYWSTPPHATRDQTREWLDGMIAASEAAGDPHLDFVIAFEGRVIGKAGFWRVPEIGYILHPGCWGQGLAGEALTAILDHAFATGATETAVADVDPRNAGSLRLLARLGFRETGRAARTWQVGGEWCDSVYLALRRSPGALNPR